MSEYLLPNARTRNLVVQNLPGELLVYDLDKNKAICLNQTAKLIWEQCDGRTTLEKAADNIGRKLKTKISKEIMWAALGQLKKNDLFDENQSGFEIPKVSRRRLMKSGLAFSIALPFIYSLAAPAANYAQSAAACTSAGGGCSVVAGKDKCCPGGSCTSQMNGICCLILTVTCNPANDFCCPGTFCSAATNKCTIP